MQKNLHSLEKFLHWLEILVALVTNNILFFFAWTSWTLCGYQSLMRKKKNFRKGTPKYQNKQAPKAGGCASWTNAYKCKICWIVQNVGNEPICAKFAMFWKLFDYVQTVKNLQDFFKCAKLSRMWINA